MYFLLMLVKIEKLGYYYLKYIRKDYDFVKIMQLTNYKKKSNTYGLCEFIIIINTSLTHHMKVVCYSINGFCKMALLKIH